MNSVDSLVVMATGSGKSLCYQVPALMGEGRSGEPGLVIVISPLLSLMHDQVSALRARNVNAASTAEADGVNKAFQREVRLLYTTPESALGNLRNRLGDLHLRVGIRLLAIDEAHCVSEWGHDFRPEYRRLAELRSVLPGVPVMALTATATPRVQAEMVRNLALGDCGGGRHVSVVSTFDRPNLHYTSIDKNSEEAEQVLRALVAQSSSDEAEPSIVYVLTHKDAEKMVDRLVAMGACSQKVSFYHAGLSDSRRTEVHNSFLNDTINIVVATTAFGMGIDKPNIRHVVHWGAPKTLESYYQQSGRAGRDGMESRCTLLYCGQDFVMGSFYERSSNGGHLISQVARDALHEGLAKMKKYCHLTSCRRAYLLDYFGEGLPAHDEGNCGRCDNCERAAFAKSSGKHLERDMQERARELLNAVIQCNHSYGVGKYVHFLRGTGGSVIPESFKKRAGYGKGVSRSSEYWKELANQLLAADPPLLVEEARMGSGYSGGGRGQQTFKIIKVSRVGMDWYKATPARPLMLVLSKALEAFEDRERWVAQRKHQVLSKENTPKSAAGSGVPPKLVLAAVHQAPHGGQHVRDLASQPGSAEKLSQRSQGDGCELQVQEQQLQKVLTRVRRELATEADLPPATICADPLIVELCRQRPSSRDALYSINGASQAFISKHGERFCQEIVKFCDLEFIDLEVDAGGWVDASSFSYSCPSSAMKRGRSSSQGSRLGSERDLPAWMGAAVGVKRLKSRLQGHGRDHDVANEENLSQQPQHKHGEDMSEKMAQFLSQESEEERRKTRMENFLNGPASSIVATTTGQESSLHKETHDTGRQEPQCEERQGPPREAGMPGTGHTRLPDGPPRYPEASKGRTDVLLELDQAAQSEAVKSKVSVGVEAVYKAFQVVALGRGSKGLVQLWAATRMHRLAALAVPQCSQHDGRSDSSQSRGSQQQHVGKASNAVMAMVWTDLEVGDRQQEAFDMFANGAPLDRLAKRFSVSRETIIGYIACVLSVQEYDGMAGSQDLWKALLQAAGVDARSALMWEPGTARDSGASSVNSPSQGGWGRLAGGKSGIIAIEPLRMSIYDIEPNTQEDGQVEEEEVSVEELQMIELAMQQAESQSLDGGQGDEQASISSASPVRGSSACSISMTCAEAAAATSDAWSLDRDRLLHFIYENRRNGAALEAIRLNFSVDNSQREQTLQAILLKLEEEAEVFREGPSKIFPI